jgi:hypothetical protein
MEADEQRARQQVLLQRRQGRWRSLRQDVAGVSPKDEWTDEDLMALIT